MTGQLTPDDFSAFVREVHRRDPFPWQQRLAERVLHDRWPKSLDVPTSLGKTSVIDVAVFAAAAGAPQGRRRVIFVVDRRLVVDEAWEHARHLRQALETAAPGSVSAAVAAGLLARIAPEAAAGTREPLRVVRMRGGVSWDWRWLPRPDQPAVVVATVDQAGSRLLFRGYGVGERLLSLDAALVGTDSLVVVDEAHLSKPFVDTARVVADRATTRLPVSAPLLLTMSATSAATDPEPIFNLADHDADPQARQRLHAAKRLGTIAVATTDKTVDDDLPAALAQLARTLTTTSAQVVGVFTNTVGRARATHRLLANTHPGRVLLLTGRSRQFDRDLLLDEWLPRLKVGRARPTSDGPWFVVATQTLEVGANIDFDALVTENAAVDALIQRLGRLNRLGQAEGTAHALVVAATRKNDTAKTQPDPVYGEAADATWQWITRHAPPTRLAAGKPGQDMPTPLRVSPAALRSRLATAPAGLTAPPARTPALLEPHLDLWSQTAPVPVPDIPVAPFLHGIAEDRPSVTVLWRAGLLDPEQSVDPQTADGQLDAVPVSADECVELPLPALRRWLTSRPPVPVTDQEALDPPDPDDRPSHSGRRVLRLRAGEAPEDVAAGQLRTGDVVVVPVEYGGLDRFGWDPACTDPALDVADLVARRGRQVLRLQPDTLTPLIGDSDGVNAALSALNRADEPPDPRPVLHRLIELAADHPPSTPSAASRLRALLEQARYAVDTDAARLILPDPARPNPVRDPSRLTWRPADATRVPTDLVDDTSPGASSAVGAVVGLDRHGKAVADRAAAVAAALGLPASVIASVANAAAWHDLGKADPRFQAMLHGGSRVLAELNGVLLAKSGMDPSDRWAFREAHRLSGLPPGHRHELLSARLAAALLGASSTNGTDPEGIDTDLVIHLIAAHHGYSRPLAPPVTDTDAPATTITVGGRHLTASAAPTVDWDSPARFRRLERLYGRWGLALLEACVRLADISCSEEGT